MKLRLSCILFMLTLAFPVSADNLGYTKDNPLFFSIDLDYAPLQMVDMRGEPHGLDLDFTKVLMNRLDIPFEYKPDNWETILDDVLNNRVGLAMMLYSPSRKDLTNYSRAVFRLYYQIVYRKGEEHNRDGLRSVDGKTIALMESQPVVDTLTKAGAHPVVVKDLRRALFELASGSYDGVICFRFQAQFMIEQNHLNNLASADLTLGPREYCYVSSDKRLIEAIDKELDKMEADGVTEAVYGRIKTSFGTNIIPTWVWFLIGILLLLLSLLIIYVLLLNRRRILREMERAKKSEQLKGLFLSNISHALRTPLNAIIGFSDLLMTTPDGEMPEDEKAQLMNLINGNGLQLLHLINELLLLSDIEENDHLFDPQEVDIDQVMNDYAEEIRTQLAEGVTLDVNAAVNGAHVMIDPKLLRMVTMHLLENAQQHTEEGKVTLTYDVKDDSLYVEVKDTGCGLPEELKDNIFALLSDKNTYLQEKTPGLGLSICKAVIDKMGGTIGAKDNEEDGRGTVVWFRAPVKILS